MNPTYNIEMFYALQDLYRDSILADENTPWAGEDKPLFTPMDSQVLGSIRIFEYQGFIITYIVVEEQTSGLWLVQQLSMFSEFGARHDLLIKAQGGAYLALAENTFLLSSEELQQSIVVDRAGFYDMVRAQDFVEHPALERFESYLVPGLPTPLRYSFVESEFGLSCELRSRAWADSGMVVVPSIFAGYEELPRDVHYRLKPTHQDIEVANYLRMPVMMASTHIRDIRGSGDSYEISFDTTARGRRAELRLDSLPLFRGILPDKLLLRLPYQIGRQELTDKLRVVLL